MIRHVLVRVLRPRTWVQYAALIVAAFAAAHLFGWRDHVAILSGTMPSGGGEWRVLAGAFYALAYFGAVLVAPILMVAAVSAWLIEAVLGRLAGSKVSMDTPSDYDAMRAGQP